MTYLLKTRGIPDLIQLGSVFFDSFREFSHLARIQVMSAQPNPCFWTSSSETALYDIGTFCYRHNENTTYDTLVVGTIKTPSKLERNLKIKRLFREMGVHPNWIILPGILDWYSDTSASLFYRNPCSHRQVIARKIAASLKNAMPGTIERIFYCHHNTSQNNVLQAIG